MKIERLKDEVMKVMGELQSGQKVSHLKDTLDRTLDEEVSERTLQEAVKELHEKGQLSREKMSDGSPGAPPYYYFLSNPESDQEDEQEEENKDFIEIDGEKFPVQFRGDITPPDETEQRDLLLEIADKHLKDADYVQEIKGVASELEEKDPRELLLDFARWTKVKINENGEELYDLQENGEIREFTRRKDELQEFISWAKQYFQTIYRLDYQGKSGIDKEEQKIMEIPDASEFYSEASSKDEISHAKLDEEAARERLNERVFGESVILSSEATDVEDYTVAGTDASVAEIDLPSSHPQMTKTAFSIFTGAAALRKADQSYTDFDFEPENFKRFRDREAYREGLLVSKRLFYELTDSQKEKSEYAAMDLRQYNENMRVARNRANWRPVGNARDEKVDLQGPEIIYSDGRIFPLVHQISDYENRKIYGDLVRNEVRRFAEMIEAAKQENLMVDSTFAGVVKNPGINMVSPLVFWYIYGKNGDNGECEVPEEIYRPTLSESMVTHLLFAGLTEAYDDYKGEEGAFSTFRILRRFHEVSLDFDRDIPPTKPDSNEIIDVTSPQEWKEYFSNRIEDKEDRDHPTLDIKQYRPFITACAQASTVSAFAAPKNLYSTSLDTEDLRMLIPRIEVAVAEERDPEQEMKETLSWYAENPKMDDDHASDQFSGTSEMPIVVPSVIVDSDSAAKFARDTMGDDVREELRDIINKLRKER